MATERYYLNYYIDTVGPNAALTLADNGAHRILYVHSGSANINGTGVPADEATYGKGEVTINAGADGSRVFRWDLVKSKGEPPSNVESMLRMSREVWSLDIPEGSRWLYRLDRINHPIEDGPADVHSHPGPGIRALLAGSFVIAQASENGKADLPGDPFWETGIETLISTPTSDVDVKFLRGMILPTEYEGRPDTAQWHRAKPTIKSEWKLYVDQTITL